MSLTRTRLSLQRASRQYFIVQRRRASTETHDHSLIEDTTLYPKETFFNPFWRNTVIVTLLGFGIYQFVPTGDEPLLTRLISKYSPKQEQWDRVNQTNLINSAIAAEDSRVVQQAQRPYIHRYRYTGVFDGGSANIIPLGSQPDLSDLVVRRDYEIRHSKQ